MSDSKEHSKGEECSECGKQLPANSPGGQCPACLLRRGFEPTNSENEPVMLSETYILPNSTDQPTSAVKQKTMRALRPEDRFGEYRIVQRLGQGGMGTVYEADHLISGRRVALKVLSHSLDSQESRNRFLREGRLAAAINHENSVYVFGTEEIEGIPTISMELIAGGTLASQVNKFGPMSVEHAVDSILQVIAGLEAAEKKGVLHRDVKPANCFVDGNGQVKIGDFGLSISTEPTDLNAVSNMTQEGVFLGTPAFASPEQLRGEQLDQRSDIYAVGVTLFYMLTGRPPFEGKNLVQLLATVLDKSPPNVTEQNPDVPESLSRVIESCLAKSSGSRPSSYAELRERLNPFGSQKALPATVGQRFFAGLLDVFVIVFVTVFARAIILQFVDAFEYNRVTFYTAGATGLIAVAYFTICESQYGTTLGKRILGLRVSQNGQHPSVGAALIRASIYDATTRIPFLFGALILLVEYGEVIGVSDPEYQSTAQLLGYLYYFGFALTAALFIPMWRTKSQPAFHDRLTDTCVTVSNSTENTASQKQWDDAFVTGESEQTVGPYVVLATLNEDHGESTVLAYDTKLLRRVWVRIRREGSAPVSKFGRNLSRPARLRWLGSCRGEQNWDCYEAPVGQGLTGHGKLGWEDGRRLIQSLTQELACSLEEGSLPTTLSLRNLWGNSCNIKILPFPAHDASASLDNKSVIVGDSKIEQEAACIRFVAMLAEYVTTSQTGAGIVSIPLSCKPHLTRLSRVQSLSETQTIVGFLQKGHAVVSRTRRMCLLLITFSLPIAWALNGVVSRMILPPQHISRVQQLSYAIQSVRFHEDLQYQRRTEDHARFMSAIKIQFARKYRDVYEDPAQWNSSMAKALISPDNRSLVQAIMDEPEPTTAQATEDQTVSFATINVVESYSLGPTLFDMAQWAQFFWIPSLLAAVFLGGGWLVRSLGVAFVDERGEPASRLRLLWRAFLPGIPFLIALGCAGVELGMHNPFSLFYAEWSNVAFTVTGSLLLIWTANRTRFLSDTLSGCYLVPR